MRFAAASGNSTRLAVSSDPSKDYEYIMPNVARDQKTSYWCGPATMEMMDLGDGGSLRTQAKWAELLGTTTDGTGIGAMKDGMNAYTTWDNTAGKYVTVDLSDRTASWFFSAHRTRVGFTKSPVVEHVQLLMKYFSYLNYNHGGHYQVGRGYSSTTGNVIGIIDPYDERDYRSGGAASGGYHVIPLDKMWGGDARQREPELLLLMRLRVAVLASVAVIALCACTDDGGRSRSASGRHGEHHPVRERDDGQRPPGGTPPSTCPTTTASGRTSMSRRIPRDGRDLEHGGTPMPCSRTRRASRASRWSAMTRPPPLTMRPAEIVQNAQTADDGTVVYGLGDDDDGEFWVKQWDPESGEQSVLYESVGVGASWSETALVGDSLYLTRRHDDGSDCLDVLTPIAVGAGTTTLDCAKEGETLDHLRAAPDGTISYLTHPQASDCGALHKVAPGGAPPQTVASGDCVSRGNADGTTVVWTGLPPTGDLGTNYFDAPLSATSNGVERELGTAAAGSTLLCEGSVYWLWEDFTPPVSPSEIRRWTPGSDTIEVVYRSPDESDLNRFSTSAPQCGGGPSVGRAHRLAGATRSQSC